MAQPSRQQRRGLIHGLVDNESCHYKWVRCLWGLAVALLLLCNIIFHTNDNLLPPLSVNSSNNITNSSGPTSDNANSFFVDNSVNSRSNNWKIATSLNNNNTQPQKQFSHIFKAQRHVKSYSATTMEDPSVHKLREQGIGITDESQLREIPSWEQITDIFGEEPVILGLETCQAYRDAVPFQNRTVLPSGLFNTGTNLFPQFFNRNCGPDFSSRIVQVNWGKHNLADARIDNFVVNRTRYQEIPSEYILPVVIVRHPVSWMFSTCMHSYGAMWRHNKRNCPHLVDENKTKLELVHLRAKYGYNRGGAAYTHYKSLIHLWKEWIHSYHSSDLPFPRLIIRLEDIVYRPEAVLKPICDCVGGTQRYKHVLVPKESVKVAMDNKRLAENKTASLVRGEETAGLLKAWSKHTSIASLWQKIQPRDQHVVKQVLFKEDDRELLKTFRYNLEGTTGIP